MKKKITYVLSIILAMYLFHSCDSQQTVIKNLPADKLDKTYTIGMNDTLKIELKSNPSTGFKWSIENKIKPQIIKQLSREFVKDKNTADMIGAGGFDIRKFLPLKKGKVYLHFTYARENGKIDKEKYYQIVVK